MTVDFKRSSPTLLTITIINNNVSAVETFRFVGSIISNQELLIQLYSAMDSRCSVLCLSITEPGLQRKSVVPTCRTFRTSTTSHLGHKSFQLLPSRRHYRTFISQNNQTQEHRILLTGHSVKSHVPVNYVFCLNSALKLFISV